MRHASSLAVVLGVFAFAVGLVGYLGFGWRFGGESDPLAFGLGLVCAVVAVGFAVRNRLN